jgi:hypothetical protein
MQIFGGNLSEMTSDSYNNLSDISYSPDSINDNVQSGGFFGFDLFSPKISKVDKAIIEAAKLKKYDCVEFMFNAGLVTSFKAQDDSGNTLLHYLVEASDPQINLIEKILARSDVKSFINIKNNAGDSPLLVAAKKSQHDICVILINKGADKNQKNGEGFYIKSETETMPEQHVTAEPFTMPSNKDKVLGTKIDQIMVDIKGLLLRNNNNAPITTDQMNMNSDTDSFINKIQPSLNNNPDSDKLMEKLQIFINEPTNTHKGGACGCGSDTEKIVNNLINHMDNVQAGGSKTRSGQRKLTMYHEGEIEPENLGRGNELGRLVDDQVSTIINEVIEKITQIISDKKNKSKFTADANEQTAKAYKAALWKMTKENDPTLKSPLNIAVAMKEQVMSKDGVKVLQSINIQEWIDILSKHYAEKAKKNNETLSTTSSEKVPSEIDIAHQTSE